MSRSLYFLYKFKNNSVSQFNKLHTHEYKYSLGFVIGSKQAAGVLGEVSRHREGEKGVLFPFLCACNKQQNSKVTPVSLESAELSFCQQRLHSVNSVWSDWQILGGS